MQVQIRNKTAAPIDVGNIVVPARSKWNGSYMTFADAVAEAGEIDRRLSVRLGGLSSDVVPLDVCHVDGDGSDHTAAFQRALDRCLELGVRRVFVPAGAYVVRNLSVDGVELVGASPESTLLKVIDGGSVALRGWSALRRLRVSGNVRCLAGRQEISMCRIEFDGEAVKCEDGANLLLDSSIVEYSGNSGVTYPYGATFDGRNTLLKQRKA